MLNSLSLEGNGYISRTAQHKRSKDKSNIPPSAVEKAAADALTLLLRDRSNAPDESTKRTVYGAAKPVPLKELSLKCEASSFVFGSHVIGAAVQALEFNRLLTVLDVSGNECGDSLARTLGTVLPLNSSLQVLFWDGNLTTVAGFAVFYEGLLQNRTLMMVQMPIQDTRRVRLLFILHVHARRKSDLSLALADSRRAQGPAEREAVQCAGQDLQGD